MYLFFDTETTGLPKNYKAPLGDLDNWPRLVQLAWLLINERGEEIMSKSRIVKPVDFVIPESASNIHGISTEFAEKKGVLLKTALREFVKALKQTEVLVAHNINFDEKIMGAEFLREKMKNTINEKNKICTMHGSTDFCKIEKGYGYKWPKLMELHVKLFNEEFSDAHDALADVRACSKCYFELKDRGVL